jgi:hypothetical protein
MGMRGKPAALVACGGAIGFAFAGWRKRGVLERGRPDEKSEWQTTAREGPAFKASGRAHAEKIGSRFYE